MSGSAGAPGRERIALEVMTGDQKGRALLVQGSTATVGRSEKNDLTLEEETVSRIHLKVTARNGGWYVQDLWSSNGTMVNGEPLDPGVDYPVAEGDHITAGRTTFRLKRPEDYTPEEERANGQEEAAASSLDLLKAASEDRPMTYVKNMELLQVMSEALMGSLSLPEVFRRLAEYLLEIFKRIDRAAILRLDQETGEIEEVIVKTRQEYPDSPGSYSRTIVNRVLREGEPVMIPKFDEQEKIDLSDSQRIIRSVLCVPLISRGKVRGVIYLDSLFDSHGFRKGDLHLLSALASPAAVAIENATLVSELEDMVESRTRALRKVEEELRESEIRFKAIFSSMKSGAMVLEKSDGDFKVLDLNHSALKIEGLEREEITGRTLKEALPHVEESGLRDVLMRVWAGGRPEHLELSHPAGQGVTAYRDYYVYRLPSHEVVALYEDVTEKKMADKEQRELQMQLFTSQKMESMGLIAGGVAHNFRNILQAIYGNIEYLELLREGDPEIEEIAEKIYDSVKKGADLSDDLLQFARQDKGGESFEEVDLTDVIEKTYNMISRVLDRKIELELELEKDLFVRGNPSLLSQVFMNLFTNARDALPAGGTIRIEARREGNEVAASISDTGIGMDKDTQEKVFDPFFTLKDVGRGTGLGLSTSSGIIQQHRGRIAVSSILGEGSTFEIRLPALRSIKKHPSARISKARTSGREEKVLVVDDDHLVLDSLASLINHLGYKAIKVSRSKEAPSSFDHHRPDLVLIDRNMPEMDGISCIKEIVRIDPGARIVIVSGYHEVGPDGIDQEVRDMIRGYITKPVELSELADTISRALHS